MGSLEAGTNGLPKVGLRSPGGYTAEVYLHGAHLTSWKTPEGTELLFLSSKAAFAPPAAIRGGVPVCWPQFSDLGPCAAAHGFARNSAFEVAERSADAVTMVLRDSEATRAQGFPHPFELTLRTSLGEGALRQELRVRNTGAAPLPFTAALHTYLRLEGDVAEAAVRGLTAVRYLDSLDQRREKVDGDSQVTFPGELDRVYLQAPDELTLVPNALPPPAEMNASEVVKAPMPLDGAREAAPRTLKVRKQGFADVVVWNPAAAKAGRMADMGEGEWRGMVCVEVAQAGSGAVVVPPQGEWAGSQELTVVGAAP